MPNDAFDILFLIARPAAGKSEIIDFLKRTDESERIRRFHIGRFQELDDFPLLWAWFEEDRILEKLGCPRLHTRSDGTFAFPYLWDVLIERLALEYTKRRLEQGETGQAGDTTIVEFARGSEHGGFRNAFDHFPPEMLQRGAILYLEISWAESLRKNRARFNPNRPHSILEHALPDERLARLYRAVDWDEFRGPDPLYIGVGSVQVPYAVFQNEDDVTSARGPSLGSRLQETLGRLWEVHLRRPK